MKRLNQSYWKQPKRINRLPLSRAAYFQKSNQHRRKDDGSVVTTTEEFIAWLEENAAVQTHKEILPFGGRNVILWSKVDEKVQLLKKAEVTKMHSVASTRFVRLCTIEYCDPLGVNRKWNFAQRTTTTPGSVDGVAIFSRLIYREHIEILLVQQFRPPINAISVELPAGLIDPGETPEAAAIRELEEETGFIGVGCSVSGRLCMTPGLSDEMVHLAVVDVDMTDPRNRNPTQKLDEGEFINVCRVDVKNLSQELRKMEKSGCIVYAGLKC